MVEPQLLVKKKTILHNPMQWYVHFTHKDLYKIKVIGEKKKVGHNVAIKG